MVKEGFTYELTNAAVGFNDGPFQMTSHKHKLTMMGHSQFTRINAPELPRNVFEFMTLNDVLQCSQEDKVIGTTLLSVHLNVSFHYMILWITN